MRNNAVLHAANVQDQCADDPSPVFSQGAMDEDWLQCVGCSKMVQDTLERLERVAGRSGRVENVLVIFDEALDRVSC